jgi:uncharacterized membrane protein
VLSAAYALHMAATVAWVGGLVFQSFLLPGATRGLDPLPRARLYADLARRFQPVAGISLAALVFTGLSQMAAHPSYAGFLAIEGRWAQAILAKHLAFGAMVLLAAWQTWGVQPHLGRLLLRHAAGAEPSGNELLHVLQRFDRLALANAGLALVVLTLTAIARTA